MLHCPNCNSIKVKKNGHIHNGKQNHACKECGRQFVLNPKNQISQEQKDTIDRLLSERISLSGICRSVLVSLSWLMGYIVEKYDSLPDHLNIVSTKRVNGVIGYPSNVAQQVFNAVGARPAESGQSSTVCGACVVFAETLRRALRFLAAQR